MRETGVVNVMTSTSIHKHPTAFFNTRLPVLEVALDTAQMTAHLEPLLATLARPGHTPSVTYAKLIAYKQGNRGLISYEVSGTVYGDTCVVFGKLYPESMTGAPHACPAADGTEIFEEVEADLQPT